MSIANRVYVKRRLPDASIVEAFRKLAAAPVADCMGRLSAMHPEIRLMSPRTGRRMVGVALTVKSRSGDYLMIHKALNMAQPGDVIVVGTSGDRSRAVMGEVMFSYAKFKKLEGLVIDAPIRDVDCLEELGLPVYATGTTPGGPYKEGPGEINVPISCGGVSIHPGDIILADSDGIIVIPSADAAELLGIAQAFAAKDDAKTSAALNGTCDRSWVDKALEAKKCEIIDDYYL